MILDGGPCTVGLESTVLDLSTAEPTLLRPGGVTAEELETALGRPLARPLMRAGGDPQAQKSPGMRSEEHKDELQSLMRISYAVFCWKKKTRMISVYLCA